MHNINYLKSSSKDRMYYSNQLTINKLKNQTCKQSIDKYIYKHLTDIVYKSIIFNYTQSKLVLRLLKVSGQTYWNVFLKTVPSIYVSFVILKLGLQENDVKIFCLCWFLLLITFKNSSSYQLI